MLDSRSAHSVHESGKEARMLDTYRAVKALTAVGFTETQAQTLIETVGEGRGNLATKEDLDRLAQATKEDLDNLAQKTSSLESAVAELRADFQTLEVRIERRLTSLVLQLAILQVMVGGLIVAALKLLP